MIPRPATPDDLPAIATLHLASWRRHYRGIFPDAYLDADAESFLAAMWVPSRIETCLVYVAGESGELAGFIDCHPDHAAGPFTESFHVAEHRRGQGIGRRLLTALARDLDRRGHRTLFCHVLEGNTAARRAYARLGAMEGASGSFEVGGIDITERTVTWPDIRTLLGPDPKNRIHGDDPA